MFALWNKSSKYGTILHSRLANRDPCSPYIYSRPGYRKPHAIDRSQIGTHFKSTEIFDLTPDSRCALLPRNLCGSIFLLTVFVGVCVIPSRKYNSRHWCQNSGLCVLDTSRGLRNRRFCIHNELHAHSQSKTILRPDRCQSNMAPPRHQSVGKKRR